MKNWKRTHEYGFWVNMDKLILIAIEGEDNEICSVKGSFENGSQICLFIDSKEKCEEWLKEFMNA